MKVVIDTNVVISAVLKDRKPEEVILFIMQHPEFQWIASMAILEEYVDVLQRPQCLTPRSAILTIVPVCLWQVNPV
jgi:predicted nucleic acid-binding protein